MSEKNKKISFETPILEEKKLSENLDEVLEVFAGDDQPGGGY